jgi:hypothetical protein
MRRFLLAAAAALLIASPVAAAPSASGTIVITSDLIGIGFGDAVTFAVTTDNLKGYQYPMVYLVCRQGSTVVYGQLDHPTTTFILGGGSSPWWYSPGPASCEATLWAYGGLRHQRVFLAGPLTFEATG